MNASHSLPRHLVVSGAKSRSHLVHVAAYVRWLLSRPDVENVKLSFIEAQAFLSAPVVTLDDVADLLPRDPRLVLEDGLPGDVFDPDARAEYVSVGAPGLGMLLRLARANGLRRFGVVVTDEGIGTYGSWLTRRAAMERQGVRSVVATAKALVISGVARVATTRRWAAYRRDRRGWHVTPHIADEFRRHAEAAVPGTDRTAVVLTQPFADLGLIEPTTQLAYVDAMCAAARAVGLEPVLRPHPAEDRARYGDRPLMAARGTAELDPQVVGASLVMGGPSTALVNVSAMHDATVLWVSVPGLEHLDTDVSHRQASILRAFLGHPVDVGQVEDAVRTLVADPHEP